MRRAEPTPLPPPHGKEMRTPRVIQRQSFIWRHHGGDTGLCPHMLWWRVPEQQQAPLLQEGTASADGSSWGGGGSPSPTFPSTVTPGDPTKGEAPRTDEVPTPFPSPSHGYRRLRTSCSSASSCALRAAPSPSLAITQSKGTPWSRPHSDSASSTPGEEQSPQNGSESPTLCSVLWGFMQKLRVLQPGGGCGDGGWQWGQEMAAGKRDRYWDRGWL